MSTVPLVHVTTSTPPKCASKWQSTTPRLLYRGALALPDSHLLLDGLTFTIDLPNDDHQASIKLLETPLPLALESMRGRPSLSFVGVERLDALEKQKLACEYDEGVNLHIHPRSYLTRRIFFENLCTSPVDPSSQRSNVGIRVRLGDSDSSSNAASYSEIIIYGRVHPSSSAMQLCATRLVPIVPAPALPKAVSKLRPPRPDDPTPRKVPAGFSLARIGMNAGAGTKRSAALVATAVEETGAKKKLKKEDKPAGVPDLGKNTRVGQKPAGAAAFKVPTLPAPKKGSAKGKEKSTPMDLDLFDESQVDGPVSDLESQNKMFVKKLTVKLLATSGITKHDPEFKEFFSHVYRGTSFALRIRMKSVPMEGSQNEEDIVERNASAHISMYLSGRGIEMSTVR